MLVHLKVICSFKLEIGYGQVNQEREHTPLSLSAVGYEQGMVTNPQRLQPPPLLNSHFLGQSSYSPERYMYAVTRPFPVFLPEM